MLGFLVRGLDPVVIEAKGHREIGEAGNDVPMKIDRVQFDMRHGMQKRDPTLGTAGTAAWHVLWRQQHGLARGKPGRGMGPAKRGLGAAVGGGQHRHRHLCQALRHPFGPQNS